MIDHDPLWNPGSEADADLARIERLLLRYGTQSRTLAMPTMQARTGRPRRYIRWAIAAGIASLLVVGGLQYRLSWQSGASWSVARSNGTTTRLESLLPGQTLQTSATQSARITVARIGTIELARNSLLKLAETGSGKHRVELEQGHLRARIWAPPGYFGVRAGDAEVVDLGCDFDVWKEADGTGRVLVRSGWVSYRVGGEDILAPQGYGFSFANGHAQTPLRPDAPAQLASSIRILEASMRNRINNPSIIAEQAENVARATRDEDAFTLISLLSRWPHLATTDLYPRLAAALQIPKPSVEHRRAWAVGDPNAIDSWWTELPSHPKRWWNNWTDLFD